MQNITNGGFRTSNFFGVVVLILFFSHSLLAQKAMPNRSFEITLEADEKIEAEIKTNGRFNKTTGKPIALYGLDFEVPQGTPESMAMYYIENEAKKLGIPTHEITNLRHHATRSTNAGHVVRYRQYSGNYPVNRNEVTITISPENKVVYVMNSYESNIDMANVQPRIPANDAYTAAFNYLNVQSDVSYSNSSLVVYKNTKIKKLAHEVVISTTEPLGEWHIFVDALNGEIFKVVDKNHYYGEHDNHDHAHCEEMVLEIDESHGIDILLREEGFYLDSNDRGTIGMRNLSKNTHHQLVVLGEIVVQHLPMNGRMLIPE